METKLTEYLNEISKIQGLLQLWNVQKANGWYSIEKTEVLDTIRIILKPREHDYICNGHIEEIEKITDENSNLSYHTYFIDVTSILVEVKDRHIINANAPQINLNFYMHE